MLFPHFLRACLLAACCLLAKPVGSTLDTKEGYKTGSVVKLSKKIFVKNFFTKFQNLCLRQQAPCHIRKTKHWRTQHHTAHASYARMASTSALDTVHRAKSTLLVSFMRKASRKRPPNDQQVNPPTKLICTQTTPRRQRRLRKTNWLLPKMHNTFIFEIPQIDIRPDVSAH